MFIRTHLSFVVIFAAPALLAGCATPARMHTEAQLNDVALGCGLALGELIQDESEKRLLFLFKPGATPAQRICVARWARANHLHLSIVEAINFPDEPKS